MGFFKRLLGICQTEVPVDNDCWKFADGVVMLDVSRSAELSKRGGAIRLEGKALPERVLVVHGDDGEIYAYKNRCTHAGRRLDPKTNESKIECCSVGKSTFQYDGELVGGSAKKSIETYSIERDGNVLSIQLS